MRATDPAAGALEGSGEAYFPTLHLDAHRN